MLPGHHIMTAHSDLDAAVSAYQQGAFDYLLKTVWILMKPSPGRAREFSHCRSSSRVISRLTPDNRHAIGEAPAMQDVFRIIGRLSRSFD